MRNLLNRLLKISDLFLTKNFYLYVKDYKNFSISSIKLVNSISTYELGINSIIDVGANRGQFLFAAHKCFPNAKIFSFEPLPSLYKVLEQHSRGIDRVFVYNSAIAKINGTIPFYESDYSHISSALVVDVQNDNPKYSDSETKVIQVNAVTLNTFFLNKEIHKPILLKIDAQGLEKDILEGAGAFLSEVDYIVLETAFVSLYRNQPLFSDIHNYLLLNNFTLLAPLDFHTGNNNKIIEMDVLYKKNSK